MIPRSQVTEHIVLETVSPVCMAVFSLYFTLAELQNVTLNPFERIYRLTAE